MPRKTKEQSEKKLEKVEKIEKKKATTTKKSTTKKSTTKKTTTKTRKTTTAKKSTTKKPSTKKIVSINEELNIVEYYDLPYRYNQTVIKLLAQSPTTLFAYWDISENDIERFKKQYGNDFLNSTKPVLIVHNDTLNYSFEVEVDDFANGWYITVKDTSCEYRIEYGRRPIAHFENYDTNYIYISQSNEIESPNDHVLLEKLSNCIILKNIKTQEVRKKQISTLAVSKSLYPIYALYQDNDINDLSNLTSNTSSSFMYKKN